MFAILIDVKDVIFYVGEFFGLPTKVGRICR
jgi:hypothetical protein